MNCQGYRTRTIEYTGTLMLSLTVPQESQKGCFQHVLWCIRIRIKGIKNFFFLKFVFLVASNLI